MIFDSIRPRAPAVWIGVFIVVSAVAGVVFLTLRSDADEAHELRTMAVPAAPGSGMYSLTQGGGGELYLSWIESDSTKHVLRASSLQGGQWTPPQTIASGSDWFINWADRPSIVALPNGALAAHWLVNNPGMVQSDYAYGIEAAYSSDKGETWRTILQAGRESAEKNQYTGFLSFLAGGNTLLAAYLSPPQGEEAGSDPDEHLMALRLASFGADGDLRFDGVLDEDVCSCCPLDAAETELGPVVVYRDRLPGEIRDISIVRNVAGEWSEPRPVHADGWEITGCPTNGPAIAAAGRRVVVSWFTGAGGQAEVRLAFSDDAGATFGAPVRVNQGQPIGYSGVVLLDDGGAVVSWLEYGSSGRLVVRMRHVASEGSLGAPVFVAETTDGRSGGMPQLARVGEEAIVVWSSDGQIRSAMLSLAAWEGS